MEVKEEPWTYHDLSRSDHHCHEEPLHQALLHWQQAYCLQDWYGQVQHANVDIPDAINYIQLGTGATHTIDDFYNYFYKDHDE